MPHFDQMSAECLVFTRKAGLLSTVAHDLLIRVTRFTIGISGEAPTIEAAFDPASLVVVDAVRDRVPQAGVLNTSDKRKIEQSIASEVLLPTRYPHIRFKSSRVVPEGPGYRISGDLVLRGRTRAVSGTSHVEGARRWVEIAVHQPDFGIKPFSALMGTLRVEPEVRVRVSLPLDS